MSAYKIIPAGRSCCLWASSQTRRRQATDCRKQPAQRGTSWTHGDALAVTWGRAATTHWAPARRVWLPTGRRTWRPYWWRVPTDDLQGRCRSMNSCLSRMTGRPCSDDCRSATLQMSFSCASDRFTRPSAHIHPDRQTDRQTDRQSDGRSFDHSLCCPDRLSLSRHIPRASASATEKTRHSSTYTVCCIRPPLFSD